jgi:hypothetical protein
MFQVLLDGREIWNRKSLAQDGSAIPDPKLVKQMGQELRASSARHWIRYPPA